MAISLAFASSGMGAWLDALSASALVSKRAAGLTTPPRTSGPLPTPLWGGYGPVRLCLSVSAAAELFCHQARYQRPVQPLAVLHDGSDHPPRRFLVS